MLFLVFVLFTNAQTNSSISRTGHKNDLKNLMLIRGFGCKCNYWDLNDDQSGSGV